MALTKAASDDDAAAPHVTAFARQRRAAGGHRGAAEATTPEQLVPAVPAARQCSCSVFDVLLVCMLLVVAAALTAEAFSVIDLNALWLPASASEQGAAASVQRAPAGSVNYAKLLAAQSKPGDAERELRASVAAARSSLKRDDSALLSLLVALARLLRGRGKLSEAQPLFLEVLEAKRRSVGSEHAETLAAMGDYAALLEDRGRKDQAEALYREAAATRRRVQPGHPDTMTSIWNLAALLRKERRLEEAEGLYREALAGLQATLGAEHPDTEGVAAGLDTLLRAKAVAARAAAAASEAR